MFENADWDIDEDYFKDLDVDEIVRNTQNDENNQSQTPLQQSVTEEKKSLSNNTLLESDCSAIQGCRNETSSREVVTSHKNIILDIFKSTKDSEKQPLQENISSRNLFDNCENPSVHASQQVKNSFLDNFQKNVNDNLEIIKKPSVKSVLRIEPVLDIENQLKRKKSVAFSECTDENIVTKKVCISTKNGQTKEIGKKTNLDEKCNSQTSKGSFVNQSKDDSRKQMMLDLLKSPAQKNIKAPRVKQTVVRKFPGPAGLFPDDADGSEVVDLDCFEENKNDKNKYSDVCSQNTKNLFTSGAWQLMTDDLPADFELYDIATIKEYASEFHKTFKKVPYLAGIIQCIDYKPNDPHVVLKDLSGSINALIHHSICKLYPNALGANVVILLKDVGLFKTSKDHIRVIVSPKNLVSIYSDDARLVETPLLTDILDINSNCQLNESQLSILNEKEDQRDTEDLSKEVISTDSKDTSIRNACMQKSDSTETSMIQSSHKLSKNSNNQNLEKHKEDVNDICDIDFDEDDSWMEVDIGDLASLKTHHFPASTPLDKNEENKINKDKVC